MPSHLSPYQEECLELQTHISNDLLDITILLSHTFLKCNMSKFEFPILTVPQPCSLRMPQPTQLLRPKTWNSLN